MTPTILERQLGTSCAAWMALFVLFHVRSKLPRCLWSKMGGNAVKWCMMKCTCNWLRRAACQGNKWSPFFFDASLILSLRRKAPPPPLPPLTPPPPTPWAVLMLEMRAYCGAGTMAMGASPSSRTSFNLLAIRSLQRTNRKPPHRKKSWASSQCCMWDFSAHHWSFPGKETPLIQQEYIMTPQTLRCRCTTQIFFHRCLFLFWALICGFSSARPFPTLSLPSIIHNPQLFLPSHGATYLQMIIFLFWNVWKRACPAATLGCGCRESIFHIFAHQTAYLVMWLW